VETDIIFPKSEGGAMVMGTVQMSRSAMGRAGTEEEGRGREVVLTVCVTLMEEESWAPVGHEVAFEQLVLPENTFSSTSAHLPANPYRSLCHGDAMLEGGGEGVPLLEVTVGGVNEEEDEEGLTVEENEGCVVVHGPNMLRIAWGTATGYRERERRRERERERERECVREREREREKERDARTHTHTRKYTHIHTHAHTHTHTRIYAQMHTHTHTYNYTHTHTHKCTHTNIYTHTHTATCTPTHGPA